MRRAAIITTGIVFILLVIVVWAYLMLNGTPNSPTDVFSNLGITSNTPHSPETATTSGMNTNTTAEQPAQVNVHGSALQQLTTDPVAGFVFASSSNGEVVEYAERGTGHIFQINIQTGAKQQLSQTTVPAVVAATFSPDGTRVVLISQSDARHVTYAQLPEAAGGDLRLTDLAIDAQNIAFTEDNTVLYTLSTDAQTVGHSYDPESDTTAELFAVDIPNLVMQWGASYDKMYAYTKPSRYLKGYLYTIQNNILTPETTGALGLIPFITPKYTIINKIDGDGTYTTLAYDEDKKEGTNTPKIMILDKCVADLVDMNGMWCAAPVDTSDSSYLDDWYKGILHSTDSIWYITIPSQTAILTLNPTSVIGRDIDAIHMQINHSDTVLSFLNKSDGTLWLYNTKIIH